MEFVGRMRAKHRDSLVICIVYADKGRGGSERTHLPAIIFALRIIIASPSSGVSVMALGVGALTISALHAFKASIKSKNAT